MQEHIIYLDAHEPVAVVRDEKNMWTLPPPTLVRGTACVLKLRLFAERIGTTPYPIANLYDVVAWQFAMDSDFYDRSPYKLVADNAAIELNSVQEFRDGIGRVYTQITIPMPSMETNELARWLGSEPVRAGLTGELTGFDSTGSPIYILQVEGFKIRLRLLSPAIVHRIVTGNIPRTLNLTNLKTAFPDLWSEQEKRWIGGEAMSWGEGG